jgi:2-oxoglutarate dehydrogenase E1 component
LSSYRRPLVVFTPKSMLRLRAAASRTEEFTSGTWQPVISDAQISDPSTVRKVLLCAGKVYYDLLAARKKHSEQENAEIAIVRIEQLYPTPVDEMSEALATYPNAVDVVWVQEEPANQGAWPHLALSLPEGLPQGLRLRRVSRRASASPAAGSAAVHEAEQAALVEAAFTA